MANFEPALNITLKFEGLYSNDSDDKGGETYKGISKKYHENWEGWRIIDKNKMYINFPDCLNNIIELQDSVKWLYRHEYWNKILGDRIQDQVLANVFFDSVVNPGFVSIELMQDAINDFACFNKLDSDGIVGNCTIQELNAIEDVYNFLDLFQEYRVGYYVEKSKKKYLDGLINRAQAWRINYSKI